MVAYIALSLDETSGPEIHRITWNILESEVPQRPLEALKEGNYEIRVNWHKNSDDFISILPLYGIKAGYVMLLAQISKLTDPVLAMELVSASSALAGALMVFLVFLPIRGVIGFCWLPVLGGLDVDRLARFFTPDALTFALYALAFTLLTRFRFTGAVAVMILGAFVRPDSLVLNTMIAIVIFLTSRPHSAVLIIGSILAYLLAGQLSQHPGWWTHFYFTFIEQQTNLSNPIPDFDLILYLKTIAVWWARLFVNGRWVLPLFLIISVLFLGSTIKSRKLFFIYNVGIAAIFALFAKMIIFPYPLPRTSEPMIVALTFSAATLFRAMMETKVSTHRRDQEL